MMAALPARDENQAPVAERCVSSRLQRIEERHVHNPDSVKGFNVSPEGIDLPRSGWLREIDH
jgi:hypothetical protein